MANKAAIALGALALVGGVVVYIKTRAKETKVAIAILDDPTEDGSLEGGDGGGGGFLTRYTGANELYWGYFSAGALPQQDAAPGAARSYVEWDISGIPLGATITLVKFRYHGVSNSLSTDNGYIRAMANQPSISADVALWADCADGVAYYTGKLFPEVGATKEVDLGAGAVADLQAALGGWFAIGLSTEEVTFEDCFIYSENDPTPPTPKPTLYVEYTLPPGLGYKSGNIAAKLAAGGFI